jgi:hypothetical protein
MGVAEVFLFELVGASVNINAVGTRANGLAYNRLGAHI